MDPHQTDISKINGLIKTTIDSIDGYREAAEDSDNSQFQSIFFARANEREQVAQKLQQHVTQLGGTPEDSGSITAGAHRVFMNLREAITGADDNAIIAEVERGEDHIKEKFESAISDDDLSADSRSLITQCYESVKSGHDQMSGLKHALQTNAPPAI